MKNILLRSLSIAALLTAPVLSAQAAEYTIDPAHSHVGFTIKHLVSKVRGEFKDFAGQFSFDPKKPTDAKGKFVVRAASISTNNEKRDGHLKSADFFDVQKYPELTLSNLKVKPQGQEGKYEMTGDLTIRGVTKPATFQVEFNGVTKDPQGKNRSGFAANGTINREDYGIVWNKTLESGGLLLGKDVAIELQVEGVEGAPAQAQKEKKAENKLESTSSKAKNKAKKKQ